MFAILLMIAAGVCIAVLVISASAYMSASTPNDQPRAANRETVASSILFNVLVAGGARHDEALRDIRRTAGLGGAVTSAIDMAGWAQRFAERATQEQCAWLLEMAVQLAAKSGKPLPLMQYSMLLDLSFGLGFHTDALAKLREQYGFEYIDHAKHGRPREADRGGGSLPLFVRGTTDTAALLHTLGIEGTATRQLIISTYRRLASQHHPDRVFASGPEAQSESAARFIEITRAYEALLAIYRD